MNRSSGQERARTALVNAAVANPLCPLGVFIADPEAHQWADGSLYIYGSRDESPGRYCSRRYDVLWTADGIHWHTEPGAFSTAGVTAAGANFLYAPDALHRDGRYYLFYCLSDGGEGVATARQPLGPFTDAAPISGLNQIDPAVFIDDDGQGYLYWGQFSAKVARLTPDLRGIDPTSMIDGVLTEAEHGFHEGCSIRKRQGMYYLSYSFIGRRNRPTCIAYATATAPLGPFTYRGVIIDNFGCDPETWNNHGSISAFNEEWFVFYHRSTQGCRSLRKTCGERISFAADGSIPEVPMTTSGIGGPLPANVRLDGGRACLLTGQGRNCESADGFSDLAGLRAGDTACFRWLDFADGLSRIIVCTSGGGIGGQIEVHVGAAEGPLLGIIAVAMHWPGDWAIHEATLAPISGIQEIWLVFRGGCGHLFDLRWLRFAPLA
jgi:arabinoxylan arabinofuranohydrolase